MSQAVVILMALLLVSGTLVTVAWGMVYRLTPERKRPEGWRPFISWCVTGLAVPLLIWMLMNLGLSWNLPPFMPESQMAQAGGGGWGPEFVEVVARGVFIIGTYWTAVTLSWTLACVRARVEAEARQDFKALCWTCS